MVEEFDDNAWHQERKKMKCKITFFRMTRNEHLIDYKDY